MLRRRCKRHDAYLRCAKRRLRWTKIAVIIRRLCKRRYAYSVSRWPIRLEKLAPISQRKYLIASLFRKKSTFYSSTELVSKIQATKVQIHAFVTDKIGCGGLSKMHYTTLRKDRSSKAKVVHQPSRKCATRSWNLDGQRCSDPEGCLSFGSETTPSEEPPRTSSPHTRSP